MMMMTLCMYVNHFFRSGGTRATNSIGSGGMTPKMLELRIISINAKMFCYFYREKKCNTYVCTYLRRQCFIQKHGMTHKWIENWMVASNTGKIMPLSQARLAINSFGNI